MSVCFTAGMAHWLDHLAPVWQQLGGAFHVPHRLLEHAQRRGVQATGYEREPDLQGTVVVSARRDYFRAAEQGRPVIYMAHGNGQSFSGEHNGYAGGTGLDQVALFLAPNEYNAALWRRAYPDTPVAVVGCPRLDRLASRTAAPGGPVCVSFHWDARAAGNRVPETWTAWHHYRSAVEQLAGRVDLVGHGHPRIIRQLTPWYEQHAIPVIADFEDVLDQASVYVNEGSSTLYEFATVGPVVVLNIPEFRRRARHGQRFWDDADVGPNCDHPEDLEAAIDQARADICAPQRREIVQRMYPLLGRSAQAAADAIRELQARPQRRTVPPDKQMFVATQTFTVDIDGTPVTARKGVTRVEAGHPLLVGRESLFEPAGPTLPDVEQATAAPGERRGEQSATPAPRRTRAKAKA